MMEEHELELDFPKVERLVNRLLALNGTKATVPEQVARRAQSAGRPRPRFAVAYQTLSA